MEKGELIKASRLLFLAFFLVVMTGAPRLGANDEPPAPADAREFSAPASGSYFEWCTRLVNRNNTEGLLDAGRDEFGVLEERPCPECRTGLPVVVKRGDRTIPPWPGNPESRPVPRRLNTAPAFCTHPQICTGKVCTVVSTAICGIVLTLTLDCIPPSYTGENSCTSGQNCTKTHGCTESGDCSQGAVCTFSSTCSNTSYCTEGGDCSSGQSCTQGDLCTNGRRCSSSSEDCTEGTMCSAGDHCTDGRVCSTGADCTSESYCSKGKYCTNGERCSIHEDCTEAFKCSSGENCTNGNLCSTGSDCTVEGICSIGEFCTHGDRCSTHEDCTEGGYCSFGESCTTGPLCSRHDECTKEGGCSKGFHCTEGPSCPTNMKICGKKAGEAGKKKRKNKSTGDGADSGETTSPGLFWRTIVGPYSSDLAGIFFLSAAGMVVTWWTGLVSGRGRKG